MDTTNTSRNRPSGTGRRISAAMLLSCTGLAALAALPHAAFAAEAASAAKTTGLEEIVVTAEKRSENIQKVPISVSALTADTLEQRHLTNIGQIAAYVPNLQFSGGASGMSDAANFFIRGIGQDDFITTTEPGVGVYLDGVYVARVTGAALELGDVKRVEVLRGPQGTLFGRNTIGGAISVVTAEPNDEFGGKASVTVGNQQTFDGNFMLNVPIVPDKLDGSISFLSHNTSGWGTNIYPLATDKEMGKAANVAGRGQLLFKATDELKFLASFDYTRNRGTNVPIGLVNFQTSPASIAYNATATIPVGPQYITTDPNHIQTDTPSQTMLDVYGGALTATWSHGDINLKSISSYRSQNGITGGDYDGSPAPYLQQVVHFGQSQFSQEFQAYGNALDNKLKWLTGLYYFQEKGRFQSYIDYTGYKIFIDTRSKTNSYAAFGQGTYSFTDKLSLTLGARWTHEKKQIDVYTDFAGFMLVPLNHREATFSNFSPMGSLQYQATKEVMFYGSITRGFRSGGFNGRPFSLVDLTSFSPETVTSFEGGVKSRWFDGKLQFNADGFYTNYRNIQVTATSHDSAGNFVDLVGNAAKAHIYGLELEVQAVPVEGLHLYGSLGVTEDNVTENPGFTFGSTQLPNVAKLNYMIGGDYTVPAGNWGSFTLGADYNYRSGSYPQYSETAPSYIHGYGLLNARLTVAPNEGNWNLTFYGKNLTNKIYWVYGETDGTGDNTVAFFGPTRQWGATMAVHF